jgi:hypothetical protein
MMRRAAGIAAAVLAVLSGLVLLVRSAPPLVPPTDIADAELYTDLASHGRLLLGPYSRLGWHHPGPVYFYLQAPLYAASGRAGASLYGGAVAINLLAYALLLWTIVREQRPVLAIAAGLACLAFIVRFPRLIASPWTVHVTILPAMACLALAAAVASGRTRLLAATAFTASFVVQTDLALVPPMLAVVALTVGAVVVRAARDRTAPVHDVAVALLVSLAVWALPLAEAVRHGGGNLSALWQFFRHADGQTHSARQALTAWSDGLAGLARPELALA